MQDFDVPQKTVVNGKLEVVGPSSVKPDGAEYTYPRIASADGTTQLVKRWE